MRFIGPLVGWLSQFPDTVYSEPGGIIRATNFQDNRISKFNIVFIDVFFARHEKDHLAMAKALSNSRNYFKLGKLCKSA